jgi:MFS family permease
LVRFLNLGPSLNSPYVRTVTSLLAGRLGDILGRRRTLFLGASVFVVGGAVQTATTGYNVMVLGRLVSGAGVGLLS